MPYWFKEMIERIAPPVLIRVLKSKFGSYGFSGNYSTWNEAKASSNGYDSENILNKVKGSLLKVKNGEAVYERDSVLFDEIEYSWPLLTALLWIASRSENKLNVVDFGGSLGSSYFQNRLFLNHLNEFKWNIIEQKHFVECGKEYFKDEHLNFYFDINECKKEQNSNAILFLSVIQYIEDPYVLLKKVLNYGFQYIVFDRTTFLEKGESRITIQRVSSKINEASYPLWLFNENEFVNFFAQQNYEVVSRFDSVPVPSFSSPKFKGYIFKKATFNV